MADGIPRIAALQDVGTSHDASRIARQRLGVRLWAKALYRFPMPDERSSSESPLQPLESGESAPLHRRTPKRRRLRKRLPDPRASVLECGCGRQPSTAFA
jgi:hypothetical protein